MLVFANLVKFSHSIFALPFALSMFIVVSNEYSTNYMQFFWILAALVSARTAAMAFNRLLDRHIDAKNPRTAARELPRKAVSVYGVQKLIIISSLVFFLSSLQLGMHCLYLSPLVLAFLFFYSYTKRFTKFSHLILGAALAMAPGGVWYALTAELAWLPVIMMTAVLFWVAGFDIIYSCQDKDFDKANSLFSMPATLGVQRALKLARIFHIFTALLLFYFGFVLNYGAIYFISVSIFSLLLLNQHFIVQPHDLSKADSAFFTRNAAAGFIYFLGIVAESLL